MALPAQTFTTLHSFEVTDGQNPYAGLVQGINGDGYGTTASGGPHLGPTKYSCGGWINCRERRGGFAVIAILGHRGTDLYLNAGWRFEMVLANPLSLDAAKVAAAVANPAPR